MRRRYSAMPNDGATKKPIDAKSHRPTTKTRLIDVNVGAHSEEGRRPDVFASGAVDLNFFRVGNPYFKEFFPTARIHIYRRYIEGVCDIPKSDDIQHIAYVR